MYLISALAVAAALSSTARPTPVQAFDPFEFPSTVDNSAICVYPRDTRLPDGFAVLAAGAGGGRPAGFNIDISGRNATQIDVAVNVTFKPVVLILSAYQPTVWHIGWTKGSTIVAVMVSGHYRQEIVGLPKKRFRSTARTKMRGRVAIST